MSKLLISLILALLCDVPMLAYSANWTLIGASDESDLEIDSASVRDKKAAWFKIIYTPPKDQSCMGVNKVIKEDKFFVEARCKEFTYRIKQSIVYGPDAAVVAECSYNNSKSEFTEYAPETYGEVYFNAVCHAYARNVNLNAKALQYNKLKASFEKKVCPSQEANPNCSNYEAVLKVPPYPCYAGQIDENSFEWVLKEEVRKHERDIINSWGCKK